MDRLRAVGLATYGKAWQTTVFFGFVAPTMKRLPYVPLLLLLLQCSSSDDSGFGASGTGGSSLGGAGGVGGQSGDASADACAPNDIVCDGTVAWRCDAQSNQVDPIDCANDGRVCVDGLGCTTCVPGATSCANAVGTYCTEDGSQQVSFACDPMQGLDCKPEGCLGACTPQKLGRSHMGCDFWPTVTANSAWSKWFPFGVLVVNTTDQPANLLVTRGNDTVEQRTLPPSGVEILELPWIASLKGPDADTAGTLTPPSSSVLSKSADGGGAYRLRSDQPVVVTQFNTLQSVAPEGLASGCPPDSISGECLSYSNDASLLLPSTSLHTTHVLMGWQSWQIDPGSKEPKAIGDFVSIVAVEEGTKVLVKPASDVLAFGDGDPMEAGKPREFQLAKGDVLQLFTDGLVQGARWSGSEVSANHPIQVLSGVPCANIPSSVPTCDHVEESNLPVGMLGKRYLVTGLTSPSGRSRHIVRIHGIEDETLVVFDPAGAHKPVTVNRGEVLDLDLPKESSQPSDFLASSTKTFGMTQYMVGNRADPYAPSAPNADFGDPSQTFVVPVSRYLRRYVLAVPPGFVHHQIDIMAATGAEVLVNDVPVASNAFQAIGASGLSVARVGAAPHERLELRSDKPFGIQMYGFGKFTSYMVPGGIDMRLSAP